MVNNVNFLRLFAIFCAFASAISVGATNVPSTIVPESTTLTNCNYDTPTNFHVVERGPDYASVAWTQPGAPPPAYNIKAYIVSSNTLVYNATFPNAFTGYTIPGLQADVTYRFELRPAELTGQICPNGAITLSEGVITDLIIVQFNPSNNPGQCIIDNPADPGCDIPQVLTKTFKIYYGEMSRSFGIEKSTNPMSPNHYWVKVNQDNSQLVFRCGSTGGLSCTNAGYINVFFNNTLIASFKLVDQSGVIKIKGAVFNGGAYIQDYGVGFAPGAADNRMDETPQDVHSISASPNPFTNTLDINVPASTVENDVKIYLYDLQGRQIIFLQSPGTAQIHSLSTDALATGMYLLRVETGDRVQTIKVMKTQ